MTGPLTELQQLINQALRRYRAGGSLHHSLSEALAGHPAPERRILMRTLRDVELALERADHAIDPSPQSEVADQIAWLSRELPQYEFLGPLYHGAQGVVFKAVQRREDRLVAVKVLLHGPLAHEHQRRRFEQEAQLVRRLRHPNIVRLYDSGLIRGCPYFAMELIEGLPIDDYVLLNRLSVAQRVQLLISACRALAHAHDRGVIHRDLKPSNILVDHDAQPHILDFGLAKDMFSPAAAQGGSSLSTPGQVIGTLPYLSPEQAVGGAVTALSDIYTMGVILFEVLTEELPYAIDGSVSQVCGHIAETEPQSPRVVLARRDPKDLPPDYRVEADLEAVVFKVLDKRPLRRYASAAALADDLQRYLDGQPVMARGHRRGRRLRLACRRYRRPAWIGVALLLAAVLAWAGRAEFQSRQVEVARIARAGLQMGAYLKEGSVLRDGGRFDQAVAMLSQAIEIGQSVPDRDAVMQRYLYGAHHRLAEMYLARGDVQAAEPHCTTAALLTRDLLENAPDNREWQRLRGHALLLCGKLAMSLQQWPQALSHYGAALSIGEGLLAGDPDNHSHLSDVAVLQSLLGRCHREMQRFDDARRCYEQAYDLQKVLLDREPQVAERALDLALTETKLATWHISQNSADHDRKALQWLQRAEQRLSDAGGPTQLAEHCWEVERIRTAVADNRSVIRERQAQRETGE